MASSDALRERVGRAIACADGTNMTVREAHGIGIPDVNLRQADAAIGVVLAAVAEQIEALPRYDDGEQHACGDWLREADVLAMVARLREGAVSDGGDLWLRTAANHGLTYEGGFRREPDWERQVNGIGVEPGTRCYSRGAVRVFVSRHPQTRRWHLSISCADRDPSWEEIRDARYSLAPKGVTLVMVLPPPDQYINVHEHTFHLHQVDAEAIDGVSDGE